MLGATQQRWRPIQKAARPVSFGNENGSIAQHDLQTFMALPQSDRIHRFLDYWTTLRGGSALPNRHDLDPLAIPSVLTGIWLITVDSIKDSFQTRLSGESVNRFFGRSMAGQDLQDALPEQIMGPLHTNLRRVRDRCCLLLEQGDLSRPDGAVVHGERLFAPFSGSIEVGETRVDHIVAVTIASGPMTQKASQVASPSSTLYETSVL